MTDRADAVTRSNGIVFDKTRKVFRAKTGDVEALRGVSLTIAPGEIFGIIGPNGSGKTTFLRLLLGLLSPTSGTVRVPDALAIRTGTVSCVLDNEGTYPDLSARDNFRFFGEVYGMAPCAAEQIALQHLVRFDLASKADVLVKNLSKGQRKLVSLCRAIMVNPRVLVVDELTANLDPGNQRLLVDVLRDLNESDGTTIVFSSHDLSHVNALAQHIVMLECGQKRLDIAAAEVGHFHCWSTRLDDVTCDLSQKTVRSAAVPQFQSGGLVHFVIDDRNLEPHTAALLEELSRAGASCNSASLEDIYLANSSAATNVKMGSK